MSKGNADARMRCAQIQFDLTARRPDYSRQSFVVTDSNRTTLALLEEFKKSNEPGLAITGPAGSGKTHLLHMLAGDLQAAVLDAGAISAPPGWRGSVAVDNAQNCAQPAELMALFEDCRAHGRKFIIAGAAAPRSWAQGLVDLETRLEALARIHVEEPDDILLAAVINQRFRERQWRTGPGVAAYAAPRISRTFAAAEEFVEAVGAAAIAAGRPITVAVARNVIADLSEGDGSA